MCGLFIRCLFFIADAETSDQFPLGLIHRTYVLLKVTAE